MRNAARLLVRAAWMWRQIMLKRSRSSAAKRIAAVWRGYCVRQNIEHLHRSADKIRTWWRSHMACRETTSAVVQLFAIKKSMQDEHRKRYVILIQRRFRSWLRLHRGFRRIRRLVVTMQAHFRRRRAAREVQLLRRLVGPSVKRLPSQLVALVPDTRGRLTRYRAFRPKEKAVKHTARVVRLRVLPKHLAHDLEDAITPLQAFVKHWFQMKAAVHIQAHWRGFRDRQGLYRQRDAAKCIQANWRWKRLKECVHLVHTSAVRIQANMKGAVVRRQLHQQAAAAAQVAANAAAAAEAAAALEEELRRRLPVGSCVRSTAELSGGKVPKNSVGVIEGYDDAGGAIVRIGREVKIVAKQDFDSLQDLSVRSGSLLVMSPTRQKMPCVVVEQEPTRVKVRYDGFGPTYDEWLSLDSPRILSRDMAEHSLPLTPRAAAPSPAPAGGLSPKETRAPVRRPRAVT